MDKLCDKLGLPIIALAPGRISTLRLAREMHFFLEGEEGGKAEFVEVQLSRIERSGVVDVLVLLG